MATTTCGGYLVVYGTTVHGGPYDTRRQAASALRRLAARTRRAVYEGGVSAAWGEDCEVVTAEELATREEGDARRSALRDAIRATDAPARLFARVAEWLRDCGMADAAAQVDYVAGEADGHHDGLALAMADAVADGRATSSLGISHVGRVGRTVVIRLIRDGDHGVTLDAVDMRLYRPDGGVRWA